MRLVLALLLLAPAAVARDAPETAILAGTVVWDETGEPLVLATVFFPNLRRGAQTDINGRFRIDGLPPGTHAVRVTSVGFRPFETEVTLGPGDARWLRAELDADYDVGCVTLTVAEVWPNRGVYSARVVERVSRPSACGSGGGSVFYPGLRYTRDR